MPFGLELLGRLAEGERLGLGKDVRHQQIVVVAQRIERMAKPDQVARDQPRSLVDELVERMLAVGPGLAPVDRAGLIRDSPPVERHALAVALHRQLLQDRPGIASSTGRTARPRWSRHPGSRCTRRTRSPMSTGRFCSNGVERKCSSIAWKPSSIARKLSGPIAIIVESPMAESIE